MSASITELLVSGKINEWINNYRKTYPTCVQVSGGSDNLSEQLQLAQMWSLFYIYFSMLAIAVVAQLSLMLYNKLAVQEQKFSFGDNQVLMHIQTHITQAYSQVEMLHDIKVEFTDIKDEVATLSHDLAVLREKLEGGQVYFIK